MANHVTHDDAFAALADWRRSPREGIRLFNRAHRRSNDATKSFVLCMAGTCRAIGEEQDALARWADDGGSSVERDSVG